MTSLRSEPVAVAVPPEPASVEGTTTHAPSRAAGQPFRLLAIASVLVPALVFAAAAIWSWHAAKEDAQARLDRTVGMLHEHALRAFETQETVLDAISQRVRGMRAREISASPEIHAFMVALAARLQPSPGLLIIGPEGRTIAGSASFPSVSMDVSGRDYFQVDRTRNPGTYVGDVILARPQNEPVFTVSRPVGGEEPGPRTIAVTSFRPSYFEEFYRQVSESPGDVITLLRQDGLILARTPALAPTPASGDAQSALRPVATEGIPLLQRAMPADGLSRLWEMRQIGEYPVYVAYGLDIAAVWNHWLRDLAAHGLGFALAAGLLLLVTHRAGSAVRRERQALAAARMEAERRADAEARLRHSQRVDVLGQIVGGVAHDFNNVVMSVMAGVRTITKRAENPDEVRRIATLLDGAAQRGARLTGRMLAFARRDDAATERFDAREALDTLAELLDQTLGSGYRVRVECPNRLATARGDRTEFETVIANLVVNARDAMHEGGTIVIAAETEESPIGVEPGAYLRIAVIDQGQGMDAETLSRASEAFFTTKPPGKGTGLGLALARSFAERNGGALVIESEPGQGTKVTLLIAHEDSTAARANRSEG